MFNKYLAVAAATAPLSGWLDEYVEIKNMNLNSDKAVCKSSLLHLPAGLPSANCLTSLSLSFLTYKIVIYAFKGFVDNKIN